MKTLFVVKYLGKTFLIMSALLSMGRIASLSWGYNIIVIIGASMYCFGSVEYQTRLRASKIKKQKLT